MFRLRTGYLLTGCATGLVLLFSFFWSLPDGKLHIIFCDVGEGDASYIRFPDGRDMVVDGGPNNKILSCLSNHMPFWDRKIDIVLMSHPQKDHFYGLASVFDRYQVDYFIRNDAGNPEESFQKLLALVSKKHIPEKFEMIGNTVSISSTTLSMLAPPNVLGASTDLNDDSLVFWLRYGSFDALFTGDAPLEVIPRLRSRQALDVFEVLKVPHHGSKTGMSKEFIDVLKPELSIISVGKNSYGHPTPEALQLLADVGSRVLRTDKDGDIEIVSDGRNWIVKTGKK